MISGFREGQVVPRSCLGLDTLRRTKADRQGRCGGNDREKAARASWVPVALHGQSQQEGFVLPDVNTLLLDSQIDVSSTLATGTPYSTGRMTTE
jgi:hypothetical protein